MKLISNIDQTSIYSRDHNSKPLLPECERYSTIVLVENLACYKELVNGNAIWDIESGNGKPLYQRANIAL